VAEVGIAGIVLGRERRDREEKDLGEIEWKRRKLGLHIFGG
jgi:hypothetical protein